MSIKKSIKLNHFQLKKERNWDKVYYAFDIHGTILKSNYKHGDIPKEYYPYAKKTLQYICRLPDIVSFLYTCSHPHEIEQYLTFFREDDIFFKYVNENPEIETDTTGYGCYDKKPYMNVLFEDKAGFNPEKDWKKVYKLLRKAYGSLKKLKN
jgi:hypothetical protein